MTEGTRKLLLKLHLWTGLATSVPMLVVALTGAFLVYGEEADSALDPHLFRVERGAARLPVQELFDRIRAAYPAETVTGCAMPVNESASFSCNTKARQYIYVDPYTGRVLGAKHLESGLRRKMFLVHSQLMAGKVGHAVVMVSTGISIFLIVTGVILWWKFKILGVKWRANGWRVNFDLHSVFGIYAAAFFLILSVTGFMIGYDSFFYPLILKASGASPKSLQVKSAPAPGTPPLALDAVIAAAQRQMPDAQVRYFGLPQRPDDPFSLYVRQPEDPTAFGRSRVRVDGYSGAVLAHRDTRTSNWGERVVDFTEAVHFGDIYGMPTRILAFVASLAAAGQALTGFIIWWKRQ
jgi:uncharacterized iron-regulated membrane protein